MTFIFLMVTRGLKATLSRTFREHCSHQVIAAEEAGQHLQAGDELFTVHGRRGRPDVQDPWNSHQSSSRVYSGQKAGADEGLMSIPMDLSQLAIPLAYCSKWLPLTPSGRYSSWCDPSESNRSGPCQRHGGF